MLNKSSLTGNYYVDALRNFLSCEARENEVIMQHIADRFDSERGVTKAIQRRKPWFKGPLEDSNQTHTPLARVQDLSTRFTYIDEMVKGPLNMKEQAKGEDTRSSAEKEKSKVDNKKFYKNMFKQNPQYINTKAQIADVMTKNKAKAKAEKAVSKARESHTDEETDPFVATVNFGHGLYSDKNCSECAPNKQRRKKKEHHTKEPGYEPVYADLVQHMWLSGGNTHSA